MNGCIYFFAYSQTSMKAIIWLCHFCWMWSGMPKVFQSNKLPISWERVGWLSWFLVCSRTYMGACSRNSGRNHDLLHEFLVDWSFNMYWKSDNHLINQLWFFDKSITLIFFFWKSHLLKRKRIWHILPESAAQKRTIKLPGLNHRKIVLRSYLLGFWLFCTGILNESMTLYHDFTYFSCFFFFYKFLFCF